MIIHSRRKTVSTPVAQKQPEPQLPVEKKPEKKRIKENSTQSRVKKILEELEEETSFEE